MTNAPRLSDRVGRLRQLQAAKGLSGPSPAAPLPGDWPPGCQAYPASFAQARLWFLHQLEPELTAYHRPAVWRLRGDLDGEALQRALEGLIERHSTLRTSFRLQGSEVIQIVHPAAPFALEREALGEREAEVVIQGWLEQEDRTPFDLTAGLLLRARLLAVDDQEHGLLINHHHIASDGWSRSVLGRDLVELYNAKVAGRSAQLEPLSISYQDYAVWQRQRLSGQRLQELNDYWISQLRDLEPLELPTDRPRPAMPSHRGGSVGFTIEPALLEPFEELCRREGATLQMGLLAVVALLLHRYSRQDDFAIGIPIWGRNHPDLEKLIGFFINTVPIRLRFAPEQSFRELLAQVRATSIGAYDHQELPFEQIVEALDLPRDASRNPFYQVMMQVAEFPEDNLLGLEGLDVEKIPLTTASLFDLECNFRRLGQDGMCVRFMYATDLFAAPRIERLCTHFALLLQSVLQGPEAPAASLGYLPQQERDRIEAWQRGCQGAVGIGTDWLGLAAPASGDRLRVCLIGDSSLAVQCAEMLAARGHHLVVIVPTGRSLAQWAIDHGIPILQLDQEHLAAELALCSCDVLFSLFNDNILPADVLATAKRWAINLHDSLLPRYAGLNAPTWALLHGEQRHGVTWHLMNEGIVRGDVLLQTDFAIPADCDALGLQLLCIESAVSSFAHLLSDLESGNLQPRPIDSAVERTYFGRNTRPPRAGLLALSEPLTATLAVIRGLSVDTEQSVLPPPILLLGGTLVWVGQAAWIEAPSNQPSLQVQGKDLLLKAEGGGLRLGALRSLRGDLLTPADLQGLVDGAATPAPSLRSPQRMLLESLDQRAARAERFWMDQFSRLDPAALAPFPAPGDAASRQWHPLPIPASLLQIPDRSRRDGAILASLAQALEELVGQPISAMALLLEDEGLAQLERPWSELFSPWVPLRLDGGSDHRDRAQAVADRLDQPALQVPFRWDLVGRKRALRERRELVAALPQGVVVCRGTGPDGLRDGRVLEDLAPALAIELPAAEGTGVQVGIDAVRMEPERAQALLKRWHQLLADDAASSQRPERGPGDATSGLDPGASLLVRMGAIAAADPDRLALVDGSLRIGYGQLMELATRLGAWIADYCGAGAEVVAVVADQRSDHILAMLACLVAKRAFVVLDSQAPPERLRQSLLALGGVPILANPSCRTALGPLAASFGEPLWFSLTSDRRLELELPTVAADRQPWTSQPQWAGLAYVIFTSGSTGQPKPVAIERTALEAFTAEVMEGYQLDQHDRVLQFAALTFDACIEEIFPALAAGAAVVCRSEDVLSSATHFLRFLERNRITMVSLPTAFWADLIQECWRSDLAIPDSLRLVIVGGEELIVQHLRVWEAIRPAQTRLINTYGPTEATVEVAWLDLQRSWPYRQSIPLGRPLPSAELRVLDPAGHPCPIGIPGELHIGGTGLARGYLNNPGLTAETFIADPLASTPAARLYRSGDLVSWNPDGTLAFHGRIDQQIKLRGFRIEPAEIETLLLRHPAVAQAAVVLRRDDPLNPRLIAYWLPQAPGRSGASVAAGGEELRSFLGERLPSYMVPSAFVELEALPLTTNGKLDRKALPAPSFGMDGQRRVEPTTDLELQLHGLWAEVLGHGDFGITDNFFLVGGHSLAAARLMSRMGQSFGGVPPLAAIFQNPTIATLAPLLGSTGADAELPVDQSAIAPAAAPIPGNWPPDCLAFEASPAQAGLWFLHELQPQLTAYHLPSLWRLQGELDGAALERALAALIERHSTLRSSFRLHRSEVVQIVHPAAGVALRAEALGERDPEEVIRAWQEEESRTPFDLRAGQLLRARLLAVDAQEHVLLINHHHIASDGWSLSVLSRDLVELYNALRLGRAPGLAPLPIHYQDYAAWLRQRLSGGRLVELQDYWMGQLRDLEPLELPTDRPRPAMPSHRGGSVGFTIEPALLERFEELCRGEGATLQMGLLAVVGVLLHRTSRQDDFAVGIPIWGRNHPDLERLIGFFINTLPIRMRFAPEQSFRELLAQVRASSIGAYDHQELPFEQMVEALGLPRDTGRNPLVQVMLQLMELPEMGLEQLDGLAAQSLPCGSDSAKLDLSFAFRRNADQGLSASITYATDVFDGDRIERLTGHLLTLLASAVQAPDASADALNLLPEAERQLINSWQRGPLIDLPDLCVHQLFERQVERTPEAIALVFGNQQLSYGELNARANRLAHYLMARGVRRDDCVALLMERSPALVVALLAILKAGAAYVPLHNEQPSARHARMMADAGVRLLLIDGTAEAIAAEPLLVLSLDAIAAEGLPEHDPDLPVFSQQRAYVMFTSGSTGVPKGVAVTHSNIVSLAADSCWRNGMHERVLFHSPHAFDASTYELWVPLLHGGQVVIAPPVRLEVSSLADLIERHSVRGIFLTTALFNLLAEVQPTCFSSVGEVWTGGEAVSPVAMERVRIACPRARIVHVYGPTETTTFATFHPLSSTERLEGTVPIGKPMEGMRAYVLDAGLRPSPVGVPGELYLAGTGLAQGYVGLPDLTSERFVADPFAALLADGVARMYRTGDLARWLPDGNLEFLGRVDFQVKIRGFRIEPGEIETALRGCDGIRDAVVLAREDGPGEIRLVAYVTVAGSTDDATLPAVLKAHLRSSLPEYMVPSAFVPLEALPLTPNGKVDRKALPAPSFLGDGQQRVEPSTDLERQLHALWAEVLGHGEFGTSDNFFVIGGHSLAAARLMALIEQRVAMALPIATIFHAPQIALMARLMENATTNANAAVGDRCLVPLQPHGEAAPLFVIHGFGGDVFCYTDFARALAPHRPVYGLQAMGIDGTSERHRSVEAMAEHYANLIDEHWPVGVVHLLGQSAGGWYAWAVASELLRRGRSLGMVAILDSGPTAAISRRLRGSLLLRRSVRRVPVYAHQLRHSKQPRNLVAFLRERRRKLASHLSRFSSDASSLPVEALQPSEGEESGLDYFDLLHRRYRPGSLPVRVHLMTSKHDPQLKHRLWRAMACGGVVVRQLFEEHHHFHTAPFADQLAAAVAQTLEQIEAAGPDDFAG
jgi:amino acid adenylation domain-containing protein